MIVYLAEVVARDTNAKKFTRNSPLTRLNVARRTGQTGHKKFTSPVTFVSRLVGEVEHIS